MVNAVWGRLPPPRVLVPLSLGAGQVVNLRVADGDDLQQLAAGFVDVHELPEPPASIARIIKAINQRLYPGGVYTVV